MAGSPAGRAYKGNTLGQGWVPLGFGEFAVRGTQGYQDTRIPKLSNQINTLAPGNFQGVQLRQYQSLLSRRFNITYSAGILAEQRVAQVQLSNNKTGTGLGLGKLKNLNVKAPTTYNNLLAKATSYGRLSNRIPAT